MIPLKVNRTCKRSSIFGILLVLVSLLAGTRAYAKGDDLIEAARKGNLPRVMELLAKGADVNARSSLGWTALYSASFFHGNLDVVQALLAKGADVNAKTNEGQTALMAASSNGYLEVVQALLAKEADVNAKDRDGSTALMLASNYGHPEVAQLLLTKGAVASAPLQGSLAACLNRLNQGGKPYTEYPNGFVLPSCSKVDFSTPNWLTDMMNLMARHGKVYYKLGNQALPVMGLMGFRGKVAKFNASVGGFAIILPNDQYGGRGLEFADVSDNCTIHRTQDGKGILTLVIGSTEWLLPDFDLNQATASGNYVYAGPVIEYRR